MMDKPHTFMGRKVDRNIDDAENNNLALVRLCNGDGQFHQRDYMVRVVERNQNSI